MLQLKADTKRMWSLATRATYKSTNYTALSAREGLQNAVDAVKKALALGLITTGRIDISYSPSTATLTIDDNGTGMDAYTLENVFLNLGGTTKVGGEGSTGGFGIAKAVILGASNTEKWEIETQDLYLSSEMLGVADSFEKRPYRQGTRITVKDVDTQSSTSWAIREYIEASEFPSNIVVTFNNAIIARKFERTPDSRKDFFGIDLPAGTSVEVNAFPSDAQYHSSYLWVRLNRLLQYKVYLWNVKGDIIVDFHSTTDPGSEDYPFTTSREGLRGKAEEALTSIKQRFEENSQAIKPANLYRVTLFKTEEEERKEADAIVAEIDAPSFIAYQEQVEALFEDHRIEAPRLIETGIKAMGGGQQISPLATEADRKAQDGYLIETENPVRFNWMLKTHRDYSKLFWMAKHLRLLILWDTVVRLVAGLGGYGQSFQTGYILDDSLHAETSREDGKAYVLLNPDKVIVKNNKSAVLASLLISRACHEVAHLRYMNHYEDFSSERERLSDLASFIIEEIIDLIKTGKKKARA